MVAQQYAARRGWLGLALFRGLLGITEAAAIPAGIKAVSKQFPPRERSVADGEPPTLVFRRAQRGCSSTQSQRSENELRKQSVR